MRVSYSLTGLKSFLEMKFSFVVDFVSCLEQILLFMLELTLI